MPKNELVQVMSNPDPKKHVIKFESDEEDEDKKLPLTSIYVGRKALKRLGHDPEDIKRIAVTITVESNGSGKKKKKKQEDE